MDREKGVQSIIMNHKIVWGLIVVFGLILGGIVTYFALTVPKSFDEDVVFYCGGIANIACPNGQECKLSGSYPDATGRCIQE